MRIVNYGDEPFKKSSQKGNEKMINIRKAKKEDIKFLVEIDKEANKEIKWWKPLAKKEFLKFLTKNNYLYVAAENHKIIGYQSAKMKENTLMLEDLYVKTEFRNKKIATSLIEKIILDNKKSKINQIQFNCPERLRRFYEKLGFRVSSLVMRIKIK